MLSHQSARMVQTTKKLLGGKLLFLCIAPHRLIKSENDCHGCGAKIGRACLEPSSRDAWLIQLIPGAAALSCGTRPAQPAPTILASSEISAGSFATVSLALILPTYLALSDIGTTHG